MAEATLAYSVHDVLSTHNLTVSRLKAELTMTEAAYNEAKSRVDQIRARLSTLLAEKNRIIQSRKVGDTHPEDEAHLILRLSAVSQELVVGRINFDR